MTPLAQEMQAMADQIKAQREPQAFAPTLEALRLQEARWAAYRAMPEYGRPDRTCSLCGERCWGEVCGRCSGVYERKGL